MQFKPASAAFKAKNSVKICLFYLKVIENGWLLNKSFKTLNRNKNITVQTKYLYLGKSKVLNLVLKNKIICFKIRQYFKYFNVIRVYKPQGTIID